MTIPYARQSISPEDIAAVVEVLQSDWLTQGPHVETFEQAVAKICEAPLALSVCNATAALHLACKAVGLKEGDRLWTSPNTFVASANCGRYCGATVDFVDIDPRTGNMCPEALREKLLTAEKEGVLPQVVVPIHFAGHPCDLAPMAELARNYGFKIIEDASHAIGAQYRKNPIGNGAFSDITVLSFHPVKIITTGEGGMLLTRNRDLYETMKRLRSHGITRDPALMTKESEGAWFYQQIELGFNFRLTDIQAMLGYSQLRRLGQFIQRRQDLAGHYDEALKQLPVQPLQPAAATSSAYHLYVIRLKLAEINKSRRQVFDELKLAGISPNVHYIPVHLQPYYRRFGFKEGDFPKAETYYQEALSLPMFFGLTDEDQRHIITSLTRILGA